MISPIEVFYILNEEQIINDAYMGRKSPSTKCSDISCSTSMNGEH